VKAKIHGIGVYGTEIGMRPGTPLKHWRINFIFNQGGMGDFVNYAASTQWLMNNCPWILGRVVTPRYLVPLMQDIHPKYKAVASEDFTSIVEPGDAMIGPEIHINGFNTSKQYLNVLGAHPIDVGFAYYAGTAPAPKDGLLPCLDYPKDRLIKEVKKLDRYAVIPVGNVQQSRRTTGQHLNPIIEYTKSLGITPVFLGKTDMTNSGHASTTFAEDIRYDLGLDLRDKTTVKEAACILQHAEFTAALDCGLLHLAALMKDSKIIFGYNITSVAHREPRRNHGKVINVSLSDDELSCQGCQSKLKQIAHHQFDVCMYKDNKCVDLLFGNGASKWTKAIDQIL